MNDAPVHPSFEYPAMFAAADRLSAIAQAFYLWLIRGEYALLLTAALLAWAQSGGGSTGRPSIYMAYVFVFLLSLGLLFVRNLKKPEQDWYRARALAESVKTSAWRYCMRADPFGDVDRVAIRREEFRGHLRSILANNRPVGERLHPDWGEADQITPSMEEVRALDLEQRKAIYFEHRIREQRAWYTGKAKANKRASQRWFALGVGTYLVILFFVLNGFPQGPENPFVSVLVVIASSTLGWVQIRKYNELVSSYTLTSQEIGIIQGKSHEAQDEKAFSDFVNEAELAFSREHTQWVARGASV